MNSDVLQSYENDFKQSMQCLEKMIARCSIESNFDQISLKDYDSTQTDHYYEETQKYLKQIEVEAMNFMNDDAIRRRVSAYSWYHF